MIQQNEPLFHEQYCGHWRQDPCTCRYDERNWIKRNDVAARIKQADEYRAWMERIMTLRGTAQ